MDKFNATNTPEGSGLYFASIFSDSPSVRPSTSKYANRMLNRSTISTADTSHNVTASQSLMNYSLDAGSDKSHTMVTNLSMTSVKPVELSLAEHVSCTNLFYEFHSVKTKCNSFDLLFDGIEEYEKLCADNLTYLIDLKRSKSHLKLLEIDGQVVNYDIESVLRNERNSWRLIRSLYEDRLKTLGQERDNNDEAMIIDSVDKKISDHQLVENLYERVPSIRQMQMVVDWLERNEADDNENYDKAEFGVEGPFYWENTLHQIKSQKHDARGYEREICTQMDPDASTRTSKALHDLDQEDESRLFKHIFNLLRAGQLSEIDEVAQKSGYHWLVPALEGWILHHDSNYEVTDVNDNEMKQQDGNPCRDIWKYTCWMASKMSVRGISFYEKAVFGILSGNLSPVLPLCPRWFDKLWAYMRASIDVQIEQELRQTDLPRPVTARCSGILNTSARSRCDLPDEYWENQKTPGEIFREIEAETNGTSVPFDMEGDCHRIIQKYVILDDVDALVEFIIDCVKDSNSDSRSNSYSHMLRFFAHLILFLIELGLSESRHSVCLSIIEKYAYFLIDAKQNHLIALYASRLPHRNQVVCYAKLLENIVDKDERKECLIKAKDEGLDVKAITKEVVENVRSHPPYEADDKYSKLDSRGSLTTLNLTTNTTKEDKKKIDSLDWLLLNWFGEGLKSQSHEIQYAEALLQANSLITYFLLAGKIDAAKETFMKLPGNIIDGVMKIQKKTGSSDLKDEIKNATREYLGFSSYFKANDSFNEWLQFYHNAKPEQPSKPTSKKFTDRVAFEHMKNQYELELNQWKDLLAQQAKHTAEKIYNVLLFPDGGWMRDSPDDIFTYDEAVEVDSRRHQMALLRRKFIPQLTIILHSVLHSSDRLAECLQIADAIASEEYKLYKEFSPSQLGDLLKKFRDTSISSLNNQNDYLGYKLDQTEEK